MKLPTRQPLFRRAVAAGALLAGGAVLSFAGAAGSRFQAANQPALNAATIEGALGQGALLGMFGGFRGIMADFAWVRGYVFWAQRDRAAFESYSRLALALDPANTEFIVGYAESVAYDIAGWEVREREGKRRGSLPRAEREKINRRYAERGLALLADAAARHPEHAGLFHWKRAIIYSARLRDTARSAEEHRRAAEAPFDSVLSSELTYVALLTRELNRRADAVAWLRSRAVVAGKKGDAVAEKEYREWADLVERGDRLQL
jgi:hypothetical protein